MSTARALQNYLQQANGVNVSDKTIRNRLHECAPEGPSSSSGPFTHCPAPWNLIGICHWTPKLPGPPLVPCSFHRWEQVHPEHMWQTWKGLEKPWRTLCCMEGRTDLFRLDNGTMTVIRYQDEILGPIVRPYTGAVGPGLLLVHDDAWPHVARVCR